MCTSLVQEPRSLEAKEKMKNAELNGISRRAALYTGLAALPAAVGCTVVDKGPPGISYVEKIGSIFQGADGKTLLINGRNFEYLFKDAGELLRTLTSSLKPKLTATIYGFQIEPGNVVSGQVALFLPSELPEAEITSALPSSGFARHQAGNWHKIFKLSGARFSRAGGQIQSQPVGLRLNREYEISIDDRSNAKPERSLVVVDNLGARIVFGIILIPLLIVLAPFDIKTAFPVGK